MEEFKNFIYGIGVVGTIGLIAGIIFLFILFLMLLIPLMLPFILLGLGILAGGLMIASALALIYLIGKHSSKR